jgi:hypothetical protein
MLGEAEYSSMRVELATRGPSNVTGETYLHDPGEA